MNAETQLANVIADAIEKKAAHVKSSTMPGEYMGKDSEGKAWVLLPGAESPTPVSRMAVEASPGDVVSVTVGNGRAVVDSNISNPSAGIAGVKAVDKKATVAKDTAEQAIDYATAASSAAAAAQASADDAFKHAEEASQEAESAQASATTAHAAAIAATDDAAIAHTMAESATADAAIAKDAADSAQASADAAMSEAAQANGYAVSAGRSLSEVEQVVGTLNWIAEHGEYVSASGTEFDASRVYYTLSGGVYTMVDEPNPDDLASYYYLVVDDSVQNYIASHLWLDDYGLNLTVDTSSGYRLHEGTVDGTMPVGMYVIDQHGSIVSSFGQSVQIGADDGAHVAISANRLSFMVGDSEVAYVAIDAETNESLFYMTKAIIVQDLRFASWQWRGRGNGNLSLKWTGGGE